MRGTEELYAADFFPEAKEEDKAFAKLLSTKYLKGKKINLSALARLLAEHRQRLEDRGIALKELILDALDAYEGPIGPHTIYEYVEFRMVSFDALQIQLRELVKEGRVVAEENGWSLTSRKGDIIYAR